ncbi:unnamed protein product, partial [Leptidea sinapis]
VSSPFYLSLNEGVSDVSIFSGDTFSNYLPLLHIPTKSSAGYCGLAEPAKTIRTKTGTDMSVRAVEIIDNTTPATVLLDIFDVDTIQSDPNLEDIRVKFTDHTGELTARLPINILQETCGYTVDQLRAMSPDERAAIRWRFLLEQCTA